MLSACASSAPGRKRACRGRWSRCCRSRARCRPSRSGCAPRSVRSSSGGHTALPPPTLRTLDVSYRSRSGWSRMRQSCVGTSAHVVAPCCWLSSRWVSSCHLPGGGYTIVLPMSVAATSWQLRPAMWNIGAAEMITGRSAGGGIGTPFSMSVIIATAPLSIDAMQEVDVAAVRQHHALGAPGRAAGEEDDERVVLVDGDVGERRVGRVRARARRSRRSNSSTGRSAGSSMPRGARAGVGRRAAPSAR